MQEDKSILIPGETVGRLWRRIPRHIKVTFFVCLAAGLLTHGFVLTNKLVNHDELNSFFYLGATLTSGRWALALLQAPIPLLGAPLVEALSMPWLNGLRVLFYIALSACFTVSKLRLKNPTLCALCGICMVVFPTVACTLGYMFAAPAYFFALLLCAAAAWAADRGKAGCVSAVLLLCFSMGIYQAYFPYAAALLVVTLAFDLLDGADAPTVFRRGLRYVAVLVAGLLCYLAVTKLSLDIRDLSLTTYSGLDQMGRVQLSRLPDMLYDLLRMTCGFFVLVPTRMRGWRILAYAILFAGAVCMFVRLLRARPHTRGETLLLAALLVMTPFAIGLICFMGTSKVHALMAYPFVLYPVLVLCLLERYGDRYRQRLPAGVPAQSQRRGALCVYYAAALALTLLLCNFVLVDNQIYIKQHLTYEQAYAYACRVAARMEAVPGYEPGVPVAIEGRFRLARDPVQTARLGEIDRMAGVMTAEDLLAQPGSLFSLYEGFAYTPASEAQMEMVRQSDAFAAMPFYPAPGSVAMIDGVLVVKAGEEETP